jgi:hypothetical protein
MKIDISGAGGLHANDAATSKFARYKRSQKQMIKILILVKVTEIDEVKSRYESNRYDKSKSWT